MSFSFPYTQRETNFLVSVIKVLSIKEFMNVPTAPSQEMNVVPESTMTDTEAAQVMAVCLCVDGLLTSVAMATF